MKHLLIIAVGALSMFFTELESSSQFYGGLLPVIDLAFIVYLLLMLFAGLHRRGGLPGGGSGGDGGFGDFGGGDSGGGD